MEIISKSAKNTEEIGYNYGKMLKNGDVVLLSGDLGSGKTVFTKGIARALGVSATITSPTYVYMNDYGKLYHYDCYRLKNGEEAESLGLTDYFGSGVCVIEWAENIKDVLPKNAKTVTIIKTDENERKITL